MEIIDKLSPLIGKRGQLMGKTSIYSILKNKRYYGLYTWNEYNVKELGKYAGRTPNENIVQIENGMPSIISKELFLSVQSRLSENKRTRASFKAKRMYLLSGKIKCAECGNFYVGHTTKNSRGYENRYYYCGKRYATHACKNVNLHAEDVEEFVLDESKKFISEFDSEFVEKIEELIKKKQKNCNKEKAELREIEFKLKNAANIILAGSAFPELLSEVETLRKRKDELELYVSRMNAPSAIDSETIRKVFMDKVKDANPKELVRTCVCSLDVYPDKILLSLGVAHTKSSWNWI